MRFRVRNESHASGLRVLEEKKRHAMVTFTSHKASTVTVRNHSVNGLRLVRQIVATFKNSTPQCVIMYVSLSVIYVAGYKL